MPTELRMRERLTLLLDETELKMTGITRFSLIARFHIVSLVQTVRTLKHLIPVMKGYNKMKDF
jgi:hypothetical protein